MSEIDYWTDRVWYERSRLIEALSALVEEDDSGLVRAREDGYYLRCVYCDRLCQIASAIHAPDCPLTQARALLKELGE
jgi:hypothetical protein